MANLPAPEVCGARCPDGPYAGVTCTKAPHEPEEEHVATAPRGDFLESWGNLGCQGRACAGCSTCEPAAKEHEGSA
jgi:hypothetical protein